MSTVGKVTVASPEPGVRVVSLVGEHDLASAGELREVLREAIDVGSGVVVRLQLAEFIDSTTLGVIVGALRRAREAGRGFALVVTEPDGAVHRALELSGLLRIFPVFGDDAEAIAAVRAGEIRDGIGAVD